MINEMKVRTILFLTVAAVVCGAGRAAAVEYLITDLGRPIDYETVHGGGEINDLGQVVGTWQSPTSSALHRLVPFIWSENTGAQPLVGFSGSATGRGINDAGQVIGYDEATNHAFLRTPQGAIQDLGTLGIESYAGNGTGGINGLGQVIGSSRLISGETHAFLSNDGNMIDLGTLGGDSFASDLNDQGQVVGIFNTITSEQRAFIWDDANGMRDLGILGETATQVVATAVNNLGTVIGGYQVTERDPAYGFIWNQDAGMRGLEFTPVDINDAGIIVGRSGNTPIIWDSVHGIRDLNKLFRNERPLQLPLLIQSPLSINNRGQILATLVSGPVQLAVLTPVSGPSITPLQAGDADQDGDFDQADIAKRP